MRKVLTPSENLSFHSKDDEIAIRTLHSSSDILKIIQHPSYVSLGGLKLKNIWSCFKPIHLVSVQCCWAVRSCGGDHSAVRLKCGISFSVLTHGSRMDQKWNEFTHNRKHEALEDARREKTKTNKRFPVVYQKDCNLRYTPERETSECAAPGRLMFQLVRYSRYRHKLYRRNTLLIRLLGTLLQPMTGFALQLLKNKMNERFSWVPGESHVKSKSICK
ncbi:hypothetical protein CSKR_102211 [Clonorchis sinensis]|uniref:Uncharacterized protein n=1 Tax=Clonorchis sinensis TaxID=79923 RepID=A0A3R7CS58_CLOSI|nr:hypothetical protein CSKR_102211 [Clonorchis sinensis]